MGATQSSAEGERKRRVGVGVGVLCLNSGSGRVLVGKRKGGSGEGEVALPGGWLEEGEGFVECALRELWEETGLQFEKSRAEVIEIAPSNNVSPSFHSVSVFVRIEIPDEEMPTVMEAVKLMEPHKCEGWVWANLFNTEEPSTLPLFPSLAYLVANKHKFLPSPPRN